MEKIYIAYGSNMVEDQMEHRCPRAKYLGTGILQDYELLFKGMGEGVYATVEKKEGSRVPVVLWRIGDEEEKSLDLYEEFPDLYYKENIEVETENGPVVGMIYIMENENEIGSPDMAYYQDIYNAYTRFNFDKKILEKARLLSGF